MLMSVSFKVELSSVLSLRFVDWSKIRAIHIYTVYMLWEVKLIKEFIFVMVHV